MQMHAVKFLEQVQATGSRPALRRTSGQASWFGNVFRRLTRDFARWRRVQRDLHEVRSLDDRMLADIGITRCEAEHVVRHGRGAAESAIVWAQF